MHYWDILYSNAIAYYFGQTIYPKRLAYFLEQHIKSVGFIGFGTGLMSCVCFL